MATVRKRYKLQYLHLVWIILQTLFPELQPKISARITKKHMVKFDYKFFSTISHFMLLLRRLHAEFFFSAAAKFIYLFIFCRYLHFSTNVWHCIIDKYITYLYWLQMQFDQWYIAINLIYYIKLDVFTTWCNILHLQNMIINENSFTAISNDFKHCYLKLQFVYWCWRFKYFFLFRPAKLFM